MPDDGHCYDSIPDIGELYDHVGLYAARRDVALYVAFAKESGGPVLEVGCGTGRVLIPIARAGIPIVGLDRSSGMLARCQEKIALEPDSVRDRIDSRQADMRSFEIDQRFALVIAPFRGFQHLITADDQMAFLRAAHRHLEPEGRLAFDVFNPDPARLASPATEETEDTPLTALAANRSLRRTARVVGVDQTTQVSSVELIWYVHDSSGNEERRVQAFPMRWFFPEEIKRIVERAGFAVVAMYGDPERSPILAGSPDIIVVADRRS